MGQRDGQMGIVSVRPDAPAASLASANPVRRLHPIAAVVKRKGRNHSFMRNFGAYAAIAAFPIMFSAVSCNWNAERSSPIPAPAFYPELRDIESTACELRALLPGLPVKKPIAIPSREPARADRLPRLLFTGDAKLVRGSQGPRLPGVMRVELFVDESDPPKDYVMVQTGGTTAERWPILDVRQTDVRESDFTYIFRIIASQDRLRYLIVAGLLYSAGELRFRSFEGYLIFPSGSGEVNKASPAYAVDFGYRWSQPPRFMTLIDSLEQESAGLGQERIRLKQLRTSLQELSRKREALNRSNPQEQVEPIQTELVQQNERIAQAEKERDTLAATMLDRIERVYGIRRDMAPDWIEFRQSNAHRWMERLERLKAFDRLQSSNTMRAAWREVHAALGGESKPALRAAKQAMEQALLQEQEQRP